MKNLDKIIMSNDLHIISIKNNNYFFLKKENNYNNIKIIYHACNSLNESNDEIKEKIINFINENTDGVHTFSFYELNEVIKVKIEYDLSIYLNLHNNIIYSSFIYKKFVVRFKTTTHINKNIKLPIPRIFNNISITSIDSEKFKSFIKKIKTIDEIIENSLKIIENAFNTDILPDYKIYINYLNLIKLNKILHLISSNLQDFNNIMNNDIENKEKLKLSKKITRKYYIDQSYSLLKVLFNSKIYNYDNYIYGNSQIFNRYVYFMYKYYKDFKSEIYKNVFL